MAPETLERERLSEVQRGLRMASPPDPDALDAEKAMLRELESAPAGQRLATFFRMSGPGYLQSAMTLGGGTAGAALFAGVVFGYQLLWVAPLAMLFGIVMLSAVAHQTLSTGMRPFDAMSTYAGPFFAWSWVVGALIASTVWHFPQYTLATAAVQDLASATAGTALPWYVASASVLVVAIVINLLYGRSPAAIRWFETVLKIIVWGIVLLFGVVVFQTGIHDVGAFFRGFVPSIPGERNGISGSLVVLGGFASAVGVNMVFLYPYSLLARGWGREHRKLARFDLLFGMLIPYVLASGLMIVATANTIHQRYAADPSLQAQKLGPFDAAAILAEALGQTSGRIAIDLGLIAMALSTIALHMLCAGFVCAEVFRWRVGSWKYTLGTLLPTPAFLAPLVWKNPVWLTVPTSVVCGILMPIVYCGFVLLQKNRKYLGDDKPTGTGATAWFGAMVAITLFLGAYYAWFSLDKLGAL